MGFPETLTDLWNFCVDYFYLFCLGGILCALVWSYVIIKPWTTPKGLVKKTLQWNLRHTWEPKGGKFPSYSTKSWSPLDFFDQGGFKIIKWILMLGMFFMLVKLFGV